MNIRKRLTKLEERRRGPGWVVVLRQDFDNPALFRDNEGNQYTEGGHWPQGDNLTVIRVVYTRNWRGEEESANQIQLTGGDVEDAG